MESKATSKNFQYSSTLKSIGLFLLFKWIFTRAWLYNIMCWSFGKQRFTELSSNVDMFYHNRRKASRAQPLKERHSHWEHDKNLLKPTRSKVAKDSTSSRPWASLYTHCNTLAPKGHTHRQPRQLPGPPEKTKKWPVEPVPGNLHPVSKIVGIILPLISLWNLFSH